MAAQLGPFPVEFGAVFPSGAYAAGGFEMVRDFEKSKGDLVICPPPLRASTWRRVPVTDGVVAM